VLLRAFLRHLVIEWLRRWLAPPDSRAFVTLLSNADFAKLVLGLLWTDARFWVDQSLDQLRVARSA
jgi:hypothetical protein